MAYASFTINPIEVNPRSPFVTAKGAREANISYIYVDGDKYGTRFPTSNTWERDIKLSPGISHLEFRGEDSAGNLTQPIIMTVEVPDTKAAISSVFNRFDEWGLLLNTPRLPGEKNIYYQQRLLHAESALGGTHYPLLIQAMRRELSFDQVDSALSISLAVPSTTGLPAVSGAWTWLEPTRMCFEADQLRMDNETVLLDPGSREYVLSKELRDKRDLQVVDKGGEIVRSSDIEVLSDNKTLRIHNSPTELRATYKYVECLEFDSYDTLEVLTTGIDTISGIDGVSLFDSSTLSSSMLSKNLIRIERTEMDPESSLSLSCTYFRLINVTDEKYQDSLLDSQGLYFGTRLESLAERLRSKSHLFAIDTILDRDRVIASGQKREFAVLPHLYDSRMGYYLCQDHTDSTIYTRKDYLTAGGFCPNHLTKKLDLVGHTGDDFRAGVGEELQAFDVVEET